MPAIAPAGDTASPDAASPTPEPELRRVAANGIEINVALAGHGPAVLLLHGFPHTWQLWSPVLGALAAQHRVIAPYPPRSATPSSTPTPGTTPCGAPSSTTAHYPPAPSRSGRPQTRAGSPHPPWPSAPARSAPHSTSNY